MASADTVSRVTRAASFFVVEASRRECARTSAPGKYVSVNSSVAYTSSPPGPCTAIARARRVSTGIREMVEVVEDEMDSRETGESRSRGAVAL